MVAIHIIGEFPFRDLKNVIKSLLSSCLSDTSFKYTIISRVLFNSFSLENTQLSALEPMEPQTQVKDVPLSGRTAAF